VKKLKGCSVNTHIKQKLLTQVKDSGGCTHSKGGSSTDKKKKKKDWPVDGHQGLHHPYLLSLGQLPEM
jgi:hypothetical protein